MNMPSKLERYSVDEITKILDHLGGIFQTVRLVDPTECQELAIDHTGRVIPVGPCFDKWLGCERCDNCTSEKTLQTGEKLEKFELLGDTIYWVVSKPVVVAQRTRDVPCVIEGILSSSVAEYAQNLGTNPAVDRALLGEKGFYVDWATKMYNRRYFDEGVYLAYLNLKPNIDVGMIVFKFNNIERMVDVYGSDGWDLISRQLALLLERHTTPRDIIIRMSDDSFLVIIPSATLDSMRKVIECAEADVPEIISDERWDTGDLSLSSGMSWASPFDRSDRHARALFREAEENAYLNRRGVRKVWDELDGTWKFSVPDAITAASVSDGEYFDNDGDLRREDDSHMATASDLAEILEGSPDTARDSLSVWLREFAKKDHARPAETFRFPMPLMGSAFEPGGAQGAIGDIEDTTVAELACVELDYLCGSFEKVVHSTESLMKIPNDLSVRAAAGLLNAMANMATGHPGFALQAKRLTAELCEMGILGSGGSKVRSACAIVDCTIVALFDESRATYAPLTEILSQLPEGQRLYAGYLVALQAFHSGEYGNSLGIINSALAFGSDEYPVPIAYLHTLAACDYMAMLRRDEAVAEFTRAWELASADGMISPFVEHYVHLQGLLDACLKPNDPELFRSISKAAENFRTSWMGLANPESSEAINANALTASEMTIAALVSRGWTNREIAVHLNLSENTIKHRVSSIFQKLRVKRRADLSRFNLV